MGILSWIIFGGLAGWVASIIMKKNASMGLFMNIIVGVVGAFIGGFIMSRISGWDITGFNIKSFIVAVIGSVVLLAIISLFSKGKVR
ncbi:MAG: GlsB/YeaQ/YmgE family stress response membrane protein [Clostridiales bacterium]|nr:GlsB/YeaQ/YmgE family stress response membrane protein [Clostridiales bacterium]